MKLLERFFGRIDWKVALSWAFFDFANSSYSLLIFTFVFPIYFKEVIAGARTGDFYWGLITSISILAAGVFGPIVGAMADYDGRKKRKFVFFAISAILGTALLYFAGPGSLLFASLLFIITNFFFTLATTFYDAFLGNVSSPATVGRISGLGWGLGYLGGILAMLLLRPLYESGYEGGLEGWYKLTFPLTAIFFLVFSLPSFFFLKEFSSPVFRESLRKRLKIAIANIFRTLREVKRHRDIVWFLLGFFLLNDALVTVFAFMPIYARTTLSMSFTEISILLLLTQVVAFPATIFFGWLADKKGPKKILLFSLGFWALLMLVLALATSKAVFYALALLTGLVVGSSQSVARSWFSTLVLEEMRFELFGFNGLASKLSATVGPLLFGTISVLTGNQRLSVLALIPFFVIAFAIFIKIPETKNI